MRTSCVNRGFSVALRLDSVCVQKSFIHSLLPEWLYRFFIFCLCLIVTLENSDSHVFSFPSSWPLCGDLADVLVPAAVTSQLLSWWQGAMVRMSFLAFCSRTCSSTVFLMASKPPPFSLETDLISPPAHCYLQNCHMKLHGPAEQSPYLKSQLAKPDPISGARPTKDPRFKV